MIAIASAAGLDAIRVRGARQNNLQEIDCDIPLGEFTVITGVSGSGKSSLAFETLYAEGQRRYVETFSAYTRQFLERVARPDADAIENIPPAVAIDQSGAIKTSRSTVGTLTGINDYLKLLFARFSVAVCPGCGRTVEPEGTATVLAFLETLGEGSYPVLVTAGVALGGFESLETIARAFQAQGYVRFLRGERVERMEDLSAADLRRQAIEVVVDRLAASASRGRRADSVEAAFRLGRGAMALRWSGGRRTFAAGFRCADCGIALPSPSPGLFSFNTPYGACPVCRGFGKVIDIDMSRVVPDGRLSLRGGAIKPFATRGRRHYLRRLLRFCEEAGIDPDAPFESLSAEARRLVLEGSAGFPGVRGFFRRLEAKKYKMHVRVLLARYRGYETCPECRGGRLRPEALRFRIRGLTLPEMWERPIGELRRLFSEIEAERLDRPVRLLVEEISSRLRYLDSVGLGYLTLGRQSRTLSGGEVERVNLTSALGASLVNTLFVLDEPSIGLHARDNDRLIGILKEVRSRGNTVVVVEHDPAIVRAADRLIDLGPGSGADGGRVVAQGTPEEVAARPESLTGAYLSGARRMPVPAARRKPDPRRALRVRGASANNLKDLDVDIPTDVLAVISGVSGSGKSTLLEDVVWKSYRAHRGEGADGEIRARSVEGFDLVDEVVFVDQSPIGRTPRGNPATYVGVFDRIRELFAATPDARAMGFTRRHFSFNVEGGRCPECGGAGAELVEMQFLSDVLLPCEACGGKRFRKEVLEVRYRGRTIDEVLRATVREAMDFFAHDRDLLEKLGFLDALGLGYLALGQPISTLSGGEAQRLKLAGKAMERRRGRLLFLLDEPTTGLHLEDVARLIGVLGRLVEAGHGVVVIEHHLDVIAAADHAIDLGPEGGEGGGRLVAEGPPERLAAEAEATGSITGAWLRRHLQGAGAASSSPAARPREDAERAARPRIRVVGARENNLKDIAVEIPRDKLVVVTGLSGSGKSSLLYDIVFAEGQRRYLDCLSPYARQFVEDLHRPDLDHLEGIPPTVAIEQRTAIGGRKSTVGTVTEIYQFLRLLFTRIGVQFCPDCGVEVAARKLDGIADEVRRRAARGGRLLAPAVRGKKGFHSRLLADARRRGILDARVDGE
ncbi:MAG: excinuclease ABC subunit UvrA, partial [Planctomycetota bacterium]